MTTNFKHTEHKNYNIFNLSQRKGIPNSRTTPLHEQHVILQMDYFFRSRDKAEGDQINFAQEWFKGNLAYTEYFETMCIIAIPIWHFSLQQSNTTKSAGFL